MASNQTVILVHSWLVQVDPSIDCMTGATAFGQTCNLPLGSELYLSTLDSNGQLDLLPVSEAPVTKASNADDVSVYSDLAKSVEADFRNNIEDGAYMEVHSVQVKTSSGKKKITSST